MSNFMSVIDIVLGALIVYGIIKGFFKGLFVEVASLLALMLGVYGAVHFSNYASEFLSSYVDWSEHTMSVSSFVITFVIIVFAISLAGKALTKLADFAALGVINKFLGALFGGLKVALILSFPRTFASGDCLTVANGCICSWQSRSKSPMQCAGEWGWSKQGVGTNVRGYRSTAC